MSDIDLTVAGTADAINMVEAGADEFEEVMLEAMMFGHEEIKRIVAKINEMRVGRRSQWK